MHFRYILLSALVIAFAGCRKIIEVDTKDAEPQWVIEANISDKLSIQQVLISKTIAISASEKAPAVSGAQVQVQDDQNNTFVFAETAAGVYTNLMRGVPGRVYKLSVIIDGAHFSASSTMPKMVPLDSIGVVRTEAFGKVRRNIAAYYQDPVQDQNNYLFNLRVNDYLSQRIYVSNDRLTNGNKIRTSLSYVGKDKDEELKKDDVVLVEMRNIDLNSYDYWYSLSAQGNRGPSQGTTPSNPPSNIVGNALGYFSAHTSQRMQLVISN